MALPLYVAVSTDTGCFAYANTTADTHAVAAALLRTGIDYRAVNQGVLPYQEPQADAAGSRHSQHLRVL